MAKKESKLVDVQSYSGPLGLAPTGNTLFYHQGGPYTGYYVLDSAGNQQKLNVGDDYVRFVEWVDETSFLIDRVSREVLGEGKCYLYYIKEDKLEYISTGSAFDYDPVSGTVFILDTSR